MLIKIAVLIRLCNRLLNIKKSVSQRKRELA